LSELGDVSIVSPSNGQVLIYNSTTSKWENSSAGFVPYTGAVTTVDLGLQGLRAGYIRFDTSVVSVPEEQGIMYWDADNETVDVILNGTIMQIGQDLFYPVKNQTGSTIAKGTAVRFAGTVGASGRLLIAPFIADNSVASSRFMGVTSEAILNGADGKVMWFGRIRGINTNAFNEGDILYASTTTAGGFQTAIPVAPNNIVQVAAVVTKSTNNGAIFVRPTLGSNINKDEGVKIVSGTSGDLLQLQSNGLWENKTIDGAGIVTKATNQTISGVKTFSQDIDVNGVNVGRGGGSVSTNTRVGSSALLSNTTGFSNTAFGFESLRLNTTGGNNTAIGQEALENNIVGAFNTAVGFQSLQSNTNSSNTAIGYLASSQNSSGSANFSGGARALENNTTGSVNTSIGFASLQTNTTGGGNVAIGEDAGRFTSVTSVGNTNGGDSVFIGRQTKPLGDSQTNQIVIGHNAIGNGSNTVTIGNSSITDNYFTGNIRGGAFIKTGGTSAQFLKADGSVDSTSYGTGSVTSVAALTLGTSGTDLSSTVANGTTTPVITLNVPTASASNRGALSSADWTTFNNKQNALTNPVTGTGTTNYVARFTSSSTIGNGLIFDNGTSVGINTITPNASYPLDVNGFIRGTGYGVFSNSLNVGFLLRHSDWTGVPGSNNLAIASNQGNLTFFTNGSATERMQLTSGGNLLVGTTTDAGFKLDVNGTGRFSQNIYVNGGTGTNVGNGIHLFYASDFAQVQLNGVTGSFIDFSTSGTDFIGRIIYLNSSNLMRFHTNSNSNAAMVINSANNVGIGTDSPISIAGHTSLTVNGSSICRLDQFVSGTAIGLLYSSSTFTTLQTNGANPLLFGTNDTERMRITSSGNVLIGTTTDNGAKLQVNGTGTFTSSVIAVSAGLNGSIANSGDAAILTIKQTSTSYNNGIYLERGGERNGYHIYIGGASDCLVFRRNYFGTQSDVMSLSREGNVLIGSTTNGSSKLRIVGLPTSAAGLSSGDVYNLSGVLMIA
jgi:hypothetical protein